jgi:LysM repeat protein
MAIVPAFMGAPHVAALAQTSPHTITANLDAAVKPAAAAAPAVAAAPAASAAASYTVQGGDTLYAIAQRYWGNGYDWPALYQANTSTISNPNLIYVGEVVTVPASDQVSATSATSSSTTSSAPSTADRPVPGGQRVLGGRGRGHRLLHRRRVRGQPRVAR